MSNLIYAYIKKDINKIVYVGQTCNLLERHKVHTQYDPFNINTKEYEYPLSRGIRKYGEDAYELVILEDNLSKDQLNEREKYWIRYYNTCFDGYNQTLGGAYPAKPEFDEDIISLIIEMLKDENYSYNDIMEKTGVSLTHIYNINTGKRRYRSELTYPIRSSNTKGTRGLKFSPEECELIHQDILKNEKTFDELAEKYQCCSTTIRKINSGKLQAYKLSKYSYPLRSSSEAKALSKKIYWHNKLNK